MANPIVTAVAAPAPTTPVTGKAPATGGNTQEGPSFKDLLAGTEAQAAPVEGDGTADQEPALADDGGEETPLDGNPLPLATPLLPPAERVMIVTVPVVVEGATQPAPAATSTSVPASTPVEAKATGLSGNPPSAPSAKEAVATTTPVDDAMAPAVTPPPVAQKSAEPSQAAERASATPAPVSPHRNTSDADTTSAESGRHPAPSSAASAVAQLAASDEGIDREALRRLLASFTGGAGTHGAAVKETTPAAAQKGADSPQPSVPAHLNALPVAAAQTAETPATSTDRLLRELKFDRAPEVTVQAPTVATHPTSLQPQSAATAATNDIPVFQLQTPMQNRAEWANSLGERISWLTANNQQNAHIRLNPAHLGPIEVQVSVTGDQTNVSFTAHHAATREALEAATPRLREMLSATGHSSVNVNINHQAPGDRPTPAQPQELWSRYDGGMPAEEDGAAGLPRPMSTADRGRLDTYA